MNITQSLRLLRTEAIITSAVLAMPIMNTFFSDIGLNQGEVGLSQALFTVALLMFNIPTGWLADRFSRKACNAAGDAIVAGGFLFYALATSFSHVVAAEVIIGIGLAFTHGADVGLLRAYCQRLKRSYHTESALIATLRPLAEALAVILGGIIGAYEPRLAIALSAVPFIAGSILSLFATEVGTRRTSKQLPAMHLGRQIRHALADMKTITVYALHGHKDLAWAIIAASTAREITHAIIWVLTPLLLLAGVPVAIVGIAWALNLGAVSIGAWASKWVADRLKWSEATLFAVPAIASLAAMAILSINVSLWTIGLYAIFGLARGWYSAVMPPIVQHHTPDDMQSTVFSVSGSLSQILYIVTVTIVNMVGNFGIPWAMAANAALFAPLVAIITARLYRINKK